MADLIFKRRGIGLWVLLLKWAKTIGINMAMNMETGFEIGMGIETGSGTSTILVLVIVMTNEISTPPLT